MPTNVYGRGSEVFWGEISPCEHLVQFYEEDGVFLDTLEGFVGGGLRAGERYRHCYADASAAT